MLLGAMQDWSLRVTRFIDHAAREHGGREIVSRWADGSQTRTNWAGIRHDAMRMAQKLTKLGIQPGDRVATLAMNHSRHLVTWYGAVGVGGVLQPRSTRACLTTSSTISPTTPKTACCCSMPLLRRWSNG